MEVQLFGPLNHTSRPMENMGLLGVRHITSKFLPHQCHRSLPEEGHSRDFALLLVVLTCWSLDNRFVLAAIIDCRICVWNASDGSLVHSLTGHAQSTYVLDVHPFNPRITMSAGYDGKTILWDASTSIWTKRMAGDTEEEWEEFCTLLGAILRLQ